MRAAGLLLTLPVAACMREPAETLCPELAAGGLVVTEIRGNQAMADEDGRWIELYNATESTVDLIGIELQFRDGNGIIDSTALVRSSLPAEPGSYTVLGLFGDAELPPHVDYGFFLVAAKNPPADWLDSMSLKVVSCGEIIDRVERAGGYPLPDSGTFSLGGTPDADRNDYPTSWCSDTTQAGLSFPGTPGAPNIACP